MSMSPDWFQELTGFEERSYGETQTNLEVDGPTLRSRVNGKSYGIGELETPSLGELRSRAGSAANRASGRLIVSHISGDVGRLHADAGNRGALFQVASQFNLLEMTGPEVNPEDGVTRYAYDRTQGPACAIAAGAATIYRNYFAPVDGCAGQTRDRQIDCLNDLGRALGNDNGTLWTMRNGYALCTESGLDTIGHKLRALSPAETDGFRDLLRMGVHWDAQVTRTQRPDQHVSQAFCSALPVSYTRIPADRWEPFARLVLEAAYEATLWAATINAQRCKSNVVFLTHLGGGAFGNRRPWINDAMRHALTRVAGFGVDLDVRIVSFGRPDQDSIRLVQEFA
jgi:hypothetical protein